MRVRRHDPGHALPEARRGTQPCRPLRQRRGPDLRATRRAGFQHLRRQSDPKGHRVFPATAF
eukprot:14786595-Heterocapsa_arctica.AAC.1